MYSDIPSKDLNAGRIPTIPDWSVVISRRARAALKDVYLAARWDWRQAGLDPGTARILAIVLRRYADLGRPPLLAELASAAGAPATLISDSLRRLHAHDLILLDPETGAIQGAYPFTQKATGHSVMFRRTGRVVTTMCAIDALGAGAMCREDVVIHSACHLCGTPIVGQVNDRGMVLGGMDPRDTVVWVGLRVSRGCAADSLCNELLFFCCDTHLDDWRGDQAPAGYRLTPEEAFQMGKALFIDRAMMSGTPGGMAA